MTSEHTHVQYLIPPVHDRLSFLRFRLTMPACRRTCSAGRDDGIVGMTETGIISIKYEVA